MGLDFNLICTRCQSCRRCGGMYQKYHTHISKECDPIIAQLFPNEHLGSAIAGKQCSEAVKILKPALEKLEDIHEANPKTITDASEELLHQLRKLYAWCTGNPELKISVQ